MASKLTSQTESATHTLCAPVTATRAGLRNKLIRTVASAAPPPAAAAPEAAPAAAPPPAPFAAVLAVPPAPAAGPPGALALVQPLAAHAPPGAFLIGDDAVLEIDAEYAELQGLAPGFTQVAVELNGLLSLGYSLCEAQLRFYPGTSSLCMELGAEMHKEFFGKYHHGWRRNDDGSLLLVLGTRNFRMTLAQCMERPTHQAYKLDEYISSPQPPSLTASAHLLAPHPAPGGFQAAAAAAGRAPRRAGTKRSSEDALRQRAGADPSRVATREARPARPAPATRQALCAGFQRCAESALAQFTATADEEDAPCECTYDDE